MGKIMICIFFDMHRIPTSQPQSLHHEGTVKYQGRKEKAHTFNFLSSPLCDTCFYLYRG